VQTFNTAPYHNSGIDMETGGGGSRLILLLLDFHQNLGASGDQARPLARPLIEEHHALAEQKRIKKHGTGIGIPR
jgi:hypothetical protein